MNEQILRKLKYKKKKEEIENLKKPVTSNLLPICKKMNSKVNSKWIRDLNIRAKIIKVLKKT